MIYIYFLQQASASGSEILLKEGRYIRLSNHNVIKCVNTETLFQLVKIVEMIRYSNGSL